MTCWATFVSKPKRAPKMVTMMFAPLELTT